MLEKNTSNIKCILKYNLDIITIVEKIYQKYKFFLELKYDGISVSINEVKLCPEGNDKDNGCLINNFKYGYIINGLGLKIINLKIITIKKYDKNKLKLTINKILIYFF